MPPTRCWARCRSASSRSTSNGFRFTAPPGSATLATGPVTQAYRLGERAWATQFHPEVRRDQAVEWLRDDPTVTRPLEELVAEH